MKRRSTETSGWVRFPIDDPAWSHTREGGTVVKLVVCDDRDEDGFALCSGAWVTDVLTEILIDDDQRPAPRDDAVIDGPAALQAEEDKRLRWERYHFPNVGTDPEFGSPELGRAYLAALVLGTSGWSGAHRTEERPWSCRFDDLTAEGQALYRQLEVLYPGCSLHLLTYLDT